MSARCLLIAMLLLPAAVTGCGQKGPLYLPDEGDAQSESE